MKKTLLSSAITLIISSFTISSFAVDSTNDWQKELESMAGELSLNDISMDNVLSDIDDESINVDLSKYTVNTLEDEVAEQGTNVVSYDNSTKPSKTEINVAEVKPSDSVEATVAVSEDVKNVDVEEIEKPLLENEKNDLSFITRVPTENKEEMTSSQDYIFLKFVPEGTRFTVNKTYTILPKKRYIIFHNGERVSKSPQTETDLEKNFCFIELKPSGTARVLKAGKQLTVVKTNDSIKEYDINKSYGDYKLRTYEVSYFVNNESIKSFTCYSSQSYIPGKNKIPRPLMIKDLKEQTGGVFTIDFPAYEEI